MQKVYKKIRIPKCDFNKVDLHFGMQIVLQHGCSPVSLLHIFTTTVPFVLTEIDAALYHG